ncbi:sugar ABC transporter ATP-binding protein [Anaerocolumna xylanovorans]|uniref:Ribose transport system ATP-binding protein n=1 Tax=Anaerocolumna xylanovorans DSM 12503 TaxID=1121345 RepID=A0A1M7YN11_9FIRM|nr:sugar ABC transporter ATP-binding protein [Anaerocolumna xylanovorans]SHO54051.1 ribose transport system ATP-binding protein [Anaerocolumna xylanovorans DSM 12503]
MEKLLLEMRGITKVFPGVKALKDVNLAVPQGEIRGLIGENGAGKSTLMNVLMGIYKAEQGELFLDGEKIEISSPAEAIAKGIGMVPQELNLNPYVSVAENIFLGNEIKNKFGMINWEKTKKEAVKVMNIIGLNIDPSDIVYRLSTAQQQLIQLSRVLATGAKLLIFDEPTASLTTQETEVLLKLMKKLQVQGKTIVFITHHLEELLAVTDRITIMRDGQVVYEDDTVNMNESLLIEHMAGKKVVKTERAIRELKPDILLKIENFSREKEFSEVSFEVRKGEIFGIGGLVGSGRTELISAIFGITKKSTGQIYIDGKEVEIKNPTQAISLGMGFVPEERRNHGIFPMLSVRENMVISSLNEIFNGLFLKKEKARSVTNSYIEKIRIKTPSTETQIKSLSGGNQQKVILARWLARESKILFLDEPTRGIDVNAKSEIYSLIHQLTKEGMTVIIVSSEHEELLLLADRIMVMHEGRVKGIEDAAKMKQQDILEIALK